jgi:hypothetical protein
MRRRCGDCSDGSVRGPGSISPDVSQVPGQT